MNNILSRPYHWMLRIAAHRRAVWGLSGVAFIQSIIFPLPPDIILMPMCLAERRKSFFYAAVCTASSVVGGIAAYLIGLYLFDSIGKAILELYGLTGEFDAFKEKFDAHGAWLVFISGSAPIPYKVIAIASGFVELHLATFIFISIIGRGLRFFTVAALLWKFGAPVQHFIEKNLAKLSLLFFVILIGGFIAVKYML